MKREAAVHLPEHFWNIRRTEMGHDVPKEKKSRGLKPPPSRTQAHIWRSEGQGIETRSHFLPTSGQKALSERPKVTGCDRSLPRLAQAGNAWQGRFSR